MDPNDLMEALGSDDYSPAGLAAKKATILRQMGMSEPERLAAERKQSSMYDAASKQAAYGGLAQGSGSPNIAAMGKAAAGEGTKEQDRIMRYGPQVQLFNRAKAALGYAGKVDVAGAAGQRTADTNDTKLQIAEGNHLSAKEIAQIRAQAAGNKAPAPKLLKDDDGNQYWAMPNQPPQLIADEKGQPITLKKPLSSSELGGLNTFDSALSRLSKLKAAFAKGVGTYPGADSVHKLAQIFDVADPEFADLKTIAGGHLLKGIKADIGGRITNFEIRYGANLFPTETDRPAVALAKIRRLEEMITEDRTNARSTFKKAGRKVPGAGPSVETLDLTK